jgi:hypothetical protein
MGLDIANRFLHEFEVQVPASYDFIYVVTEYFLLKSAVLLLFIIYSITRNRIQSIWKDVSRFRLWHLAHLVLGGILALIWVIDVIALLIYYIKFLGSPVGTTSADALVWLGRWRKANGAFHMLYLIAAMEIIGCAVFIANGARSRKVPSQVCITLVSNHWSISNPNFTTRSQNTSLSSSLPSFSCEVWS